MSDEPRGFSNVTCACLGSKCCDEVADLRAQLAAAIARADEAERQRRISEAHESEIVAECVSARAWARRWKALAGERGRTRKYTLALTLRGIIATQDVELDHLRRLLKRMSGPP